MWASQRSSTNQHTTLIDKNSITDLSGTAEPHHEFSSPHSRPEWPIGGWGALMLEWTRPRWEAPQCESQVTCFVLPAQTVECAAKMRPGSDKVPLPILNFPFDPIERCIRGS